MVSRRPRKARPPDASPGASYWAPHGGLLVAGAAITLTGLAWVVWSYWGSDAPVEKVALANPTAGATAVPATGSAQGTPWQIQETVPTWKAHATAPVTPDPERDNDPTPDLSSYVARGEKPTMAQVIERLHEAGIHTGLGAFPPPGTRPPLMGLAVPEDFVLPQGYVRHYQATDDGQRIEPILMFAPDYQPLDAQKRPIEIPKNRVVPPELAPPGLPVRRIVVPAPLEAAP